MMHVTDEPTSADLARRCRRMADATRHLAWQAARSEDRDAGLDLAMRWVVLADDVGRRRPPSADEA